MFKDTPAQMKLIRRAITCMCQYHLIGRFQVGHVTLLCDSEFKVSACVLLIALPPGPPFNYDLWRAWYTKSHGDRTDLIGCEHCTRAL